MKKAGLLLCLSGLFLFSSCSEFGASFKVFRGNYHFLQGEYENANIQYLKARETGIDRKIVDYNLGTVYNALGEVESAASQWDPIEPGEDGRLAFRLAYNQGVLHYQLGEYQEAFDAFKKALQQDPVSFEARVNLEHSFRKLNFQENAAAGESDSEAREAEAGGDDIQRVLEYIRRNEPFYPPEPEEGEESGRTRDW